MSTIINGTSPSITFSDSTTQASAGLTAASPTISSGVLTFPDATTQSSGRGVAKAWVNFAGASGTRNASYNVSSVTRTTTGQYVVNFATALADANYTWSVNMTGLNSANGYFIGNATTNTTTTLQILTVTSGIAYADPTMVAVTVFGN